MGNEQTLSRGARAFGSVCLLILALLSLGWTIRDFTKAHEIVDVWWLWSGLPTRPEDGIWMTSSIDPALVVVYAVAAATALRSSSAGGILLVTGAFTVLMRLPSLWNLNADWLQGVDDGQRNMALATAIAAVVLGAALVVAAAAGRRPVDSGPYGATFDPDEMPPARPNGAAAATGLLLLGAAAAAGVAWEIYFWTEAEGDAYEQRFTGERALNSLLDVPSGWASWLIVVLGLTAAGTAAARTTLARPLGMLVSAMLMCAGIFDLSAAGKLEYFEHFDELATQGQLAVLTDIGYLLIGLVTLLVLARGGEHPPQRYGQGLSAGGPAPYGDPGPYGPPPGVPGDHGAPQYGDPQYGDPGPYYGPPNDAGPYGPPPAPPPPPPNSPRW